MKITDPKYHELRRAIWKACGDALEQGMSRHDLAGCLGAYLAELCEGAGGLSPGDIEGMKATLEKMQRRLRIVELGMEIAEDSRRTIN